VPEEPVVDPTKPEELPGTPNPTPRNGITRYEALEEGTGNGYAQDFTYDAAADTYTIDNLGFDGANVYSRGNRVATLGGYNVYEATRTEIDPQTGVAIPQFQHRALAAVSRSGRTEFAIVRTGAYRTYGFGGFVIKRNDNVSMPTTGQAAYTGQYAAVRDFNGIGGLEYSTGDMDIAIDFKDFNVGSAVQGTVQNRQIFDVNGNNITADVLAAMDAKYDPDDKVGPSTELPVLLFKVGPNATDVNGEIRGFLDSAVLDYRNDSSTAGQPPRPTVTVFEDGNYYAIVSGTNADEVVGVIVVEAEDPRLDGVTVRETGGFILYRP
jgi:hypothetical protein